MLDIDGSYLEGGGQILRTAVALSAIKQVPVRIVNIRKGRPEPGLKAQHLTGILAAAQLCDAKLTGAKIGSTELTFEPKKIKFGKFKFDVGTAGAVTLVLQTVVPIAAFAPSKTTFTLMGGTNVSWSPTIEYFQNIFCDYAEKFGLLITSEIDKYGFYPTGGGSVKVEINPIKQGKALNLTDRGKLFDIKAFSIASEDLQNARVAERQVSSFRKNMPADYSVKGFSNYVRTLSTGSSITAHALYENCKLGASALGEKNKSAEDVGKACSEDLLKEIKSSATVDKHLADQLIPFLGLFGGSFVTSEITMHTRTNIWVTEKFIDKKFKIEGTKISI
jgi:RNA 3'-phosphate cyclase